jgi:hypothetical protein
VSGNLLTLVAFLGCMATVIVGELLTDEVRGWLDLLPLAILRIAAARLAPLHQVVIYEDQWLPELCYILKGKESRPVTRLLVGTRFSLSLLAAAPRIGRDVPNEYATPTPIWVTPKDPLIKTLLADVTRKEKQGSSPQKTTLPIRRRVPCVYLSHPESDRHIAISMDRFRTLHREGCIVVFDAGNDYIVPMTYDEFIEVSRRIDKIVERHVPGK